MNYKKLCGWNADLAKENFNLYGSKIPRYSDYVPVIDPRGERRMLWEYVRTILGKDTENYAQESGDCVSFGGKNSLEYLQCVEISLNQDAEKFRKIFPPYFYGTSRVQIGGGRIRGAGSLGTWLEQAARKYGVLAADENGVPTYNGRVADAWGRTGPPQEFITIASKNLIGTTSLVRNKEEAADAIWKGYPIAICSSQGFSMEAGSDGFHAARGSWAHCFPGDTIVFAEKPKKASEIKVGDKLYTRNGSDYVAEVKTRQYKGKLIVIKASGLPKFKVTPEHPILVYRTIPSYCRIKPGTILEEFSSGEFMYLKEKYETHNLEQPIWVKAQDVQPGDYILMPKLESKDIIIPDWKYSERAINIPKQLTYSSELGWLFGLYIGDGNATRNHKICITLGLHEEDIALRAKNIIEDILGLECSIKIQENCIRVLCYSSIVANTFSEWFGYDCHEKHIPEWLYSANSIDVVLGWQDAHGGEYNNMNYANSVSKTLVWQMYHILASNKMYPKIDDVKPGNFPNPTNGFRVEWLKNPGKNVHGSYWGNFYCKPVIATYDEDFDDIVYDYVMENEHNFIIQGCTVHNCMTLIGYGTHPQYGLYFIILNSWGDAHGRLKDFETGVDLPIGVLRVKGDIVNRMLAEQDSFAFSMFDGYPDQSNKLNRLDFKLTGK